MNTEQISDPVAAPRRKSQGNRIMSFPIAAILIASFCGIPPVASRLLALDSILHAHNDKIVSFIMLAAPFVFIGIAVAGLMFMFTSKPRLAAHKFEQY